MTKNRKLIICFYDKSRYEIINDALKIENVRQIIMDSFNDVDKKKEFICLNFNDESFCFRLSDINYFKVVDVECKES